MNIKSLFSSAGKIPVILLWLFLISFLGGWLSIAISLIVITQSKQRTENLSKIIRELRSFSVDKNLRCPDCATKYQNQAGSDQEEEDVMKHPKGYQDQTQQ
ncbi:MAG TPA: hypothetical protein VL485_16435 [Ktedonobacteraceae bacterium]|jgi:hypothetical protein|nr:hypothetical protein [Ktedonobacteraceae bacterium]